MTKSIAPRPNVNPLALPILALAGRAVLTFRNFETGSHFTAKIRQRHDKKDRKVKLLAYNVDISLLGDKRMGMRYAGMIFTDGPIRMWVSREVDANDQLARVFRWMVGAIQNPAVLRGTPSASDGLIHNRVGLFHEDHCCCCGLPLTHPESIYTGLGPVCLKRKAEQMKSDNIDITAFFEPVVS